MLHNTIKQIAKKISSKGKGLFKIQTLEHNFISFKGYGDNVFSFQIDNHPYKGCGTFAAGHVFNGTKWKLTYESEYQRYGNVEVSNFVPYHIANTDNPDYILRNALYFILGQ